MKFSISSIVAVAAVVAVLTVPTLVNADNLYNPGRIGFGYSSNIDPVNGDYYIEFADNNGYNHYIVKEKDVSPAFYAFALNMFKEYFTYSQFVINIEYVAGFYGTNLHKVVSVWLED